MSLLCAATALVLAFGLVAIEAVCSDLLCLGPCASAGDRFFCGNFGLLLLDSRHVEKVLPALSTMLRVTCMRGAQSAGLVTYVAKRSGHVGERHRVVNGKRTDLPTLLLRKCRNMLRGQAIQAPQFFQGHTRFATSSIAALPGCHPHQWCKASTKTVWMYINGEWEGVKRNVESYITHNGDLDFLNLHGVVHPLEEVQTILCAALHTSLPAGVDSMCVAGLLDLLRTAGMWTASVRYGYIYGALAHASGNVATLAEKGALWDANTLARASEIFESTWTMLVEKNPSSRASVLRAEMRKALCHGGAMRTELARLPMSSSTFTIGTEDSSGVDAALDALVQSSVNAFFDQGLLAAARQLLGSAMGSFGLVLSHSLDATGELIVAARGQTMSVAFYPETGIVMFGSESAATKAGMTLARDANKASTRRVVTVGVLEHTGGSQRLDMDDVNGECLQLRWGAANAMKPLLRIDGTVEMMSYRDQNGVASSLLAWTHIDGKHINQKPLMKRMLKLDGNPLVEQLPPMGIPDPVGKDIQDIPAVLRKIKNDWNEPENSLNRMSAFTLSNLLRRRMKSIDAKTHDGSLDVLVTGCEVSLWLGEQFSADLHLAFPSLSVECISANKLLGLLGQRFPQPQSGFRFHSRTHNFRDTIVIMISHSGGTFATLNCSNLLKAFTKSLFVVTSEWDTQVARSVRAGLPGAPETFKLSSYVFTTFCGSRPAEPCSLTVAATHQLLTQILLHVMYSVRHYHPDLATLAGSSFAKEDVQELETLDQDSIKTIDALIKGDDTKVRAELLRQGSVWAQHILEGPISWIISALYIAVTVTIGWTPLSAIAYVIQQYAFPGPIPDPAACASAAPATVFPSTPHKYIIGFIDAVIYAFLPWWTTVMLRLLQRRTWHHRVAGRSLLIGDVPWVAQSLEAFTSKLFALSYSIASVSVASGNPSDHLVHRHTHRVVRGGLLAVGRPDGRLNALSAAENTVCLSVNQASSIQNMGVTCESITIGANPSKMSLTKNNIFLPRQRPLFFSEYVVEKFRSGDEKITGVGSMSAGALMGKLTGLQDTQADDDDNGINDVFDEVIAKSFKKKNVSTHAELKTLAEEPQEGDAGVYRKIPAIRDEFVGSWMAYDTRYQGFTNQELMDRQHLIQSLYESRIGALHRFVAFLVMFHKMGKTVQDFWPKVSFGLLKYDMSRTHSIMRIATTASPVSGMEVREKTLELAEQTKHTFAMNMLQLMAAKWYVFGKLDIDKDEEKVENMMKLLFQSGGAKYISQSSQKASKGGSRQSTPAMRRPPSVQIDPIQSTVGENRSVLARANLLPVGGVNVGPSPLSSPMTTPNTSLHAAGLWTKQSAQNASPSQKSNGQNGNDHPSEASIRLPVSFRTEPEMTRSSRV